jgi:hypothetical protein
MSKYEDAIKIKKEINEIIKDLNDHYSLFYDINGKFQLNPYLKKETKQYIKKNLLSMDNLNYVIKEELIRCLRLKISRYINEAKKEAREILDHIEEKNE